MYHWCKSWLCAFAPPEKLSPSEWTEKYRVLPPSSAEPGPLRLARTPHIRGIMDSLLEPIEVIVIPKATQVCISTMLESFIGYWVGNDPGPTLYVLDTEPSAKAVVEERIRPLIESTPAVASHTLPSPHDSTLERIHFDTCDLFMGHAGSVASLARRAIRHLLLDEVDKYPTNAGREADPISLAMERVTSFGHRARVVMCSSVTTRDGPIWRAWESVGDKRAYYIPCPSCGSYQVMVFGQLKFPHAPPDEIKHQDLAHYECLRCQAKIKDAQRYKMLAGGVWLSQGQTINDAGVVSGEKPKAKWIGFRPDCFVSPWRTFSAVATEFVRSKGNPSWMRNFKNSWLAEPFEIILKKRSLNEMRALLVGAPEPLVLPPWVEYIIASADVHKETGKGIYYAIRAWGYHYRSQLLHHGIVQTFEELAVACLQTHFPFGNMTVLPHLLVIDAGYRTSEVYDFSRTDEKIRPVKGDNDTQAQLVKLSDRAAEFGVPLYKLNTQLLKDKLAVLQADQGRWLLNTAVDDEYLRQLAAEHKVIIKGREKWQKKSQGLANEWLDVEVYNLAGAEILGIAALEPPAQAAEQAAEADQTERPEEDEGPSWIPRHKRWL